MASMKDELPLCEESVVEDFLPDLDIDVDVHRVKAGVLRRHEAAAWLREIVGIIAAKDLPAEPSEGEFREGLRSGIILCKALNKVQHGAVHKVVENPCDSSLIPDGAALSAYQYFENLRNFLVVAQEMGLPTFDASDLQQGGNSSRVVNSVLALKSYHEWKKAGGRGVWKFCGNMKPTTSAKQFIRKNSEPFASFLSRNITGSEKALNNMNSKEASNGTANSPLSEFLRAILLDKKSEEVPNLVESLLRKVMEQFGHHNASQTELVDSRDASICNVSTSKTYSVGMMNEGKAEAVETRELVLLQKNKRRGESDSRFMKQHMIVRQQQKDIKVLKQTLSSTKAGMQLMQMKFRDEIHRLGLHLNVLAHAASSYHIVLEENRKLYNEVQDLKGSIRVYCRVRPFLSGQYDYFSSVERIDEETITINTSTRSGKGQKSFSFNKVYGASATQEEVYADTQPLVRSVLDGYNICIFAYGQTGSGKTFTMTGPKDINQKNRGVNYRALSDLFLLAEQRKDTHTYEISVQMIEIYNEQVRDLLLTDGLSKRLEIRNSSQTGLNVPDASLVHVSSTFDVVELMRLGQNNRAVGATALNDRSSRSHSCLTVHVQGRDLNSGNVLRGCMHLVDLAGSERVDKSEVMGERLKEAQHINKSLAALGDVISSLAQKNSHVPYRNSKLTQLLQDSLGGQAKTLMFVHISPEADAFGETISTLKFAERVASVELGAARVNNTSDVKALREQVASLKSALARKEGERTPVTVNRSKMQRSPVQHGLVSSSPIGLRKPMEEVGNIEICENSAPLQKKRNWDPNDLLRSSPVRSNGCSPRHIKEDFDTEIETNGWIDKLMVKKQMQDHNSRVDNNSNHHPLTFCSPKNQLQKNSSDSSTLSMEKQQHGSFPLSNDDVIELDTTSNDSSEPDILWRFNPSKVGGNYPVVGHNLITKKPQAAQDNRQDLRSMIPRLARSPSPGANRVGKQTVESKRTVRKR